MSTEFHSRRYIMIKILLVDDDAINVEVLKVLLNKYISKHNIELHVDKAYSGEDAISMAKQTFYDLIFMDVLMPGINGLEATVAIKKLHPRSMIIAVSSLSDEIKQNHLLKNGAQDYIVKPFNGPLFNTRMDRYLDMIQLRDVVTIKPHAINLFSAEIFSYDMRFYINSEEDLAQLWETLLLRYEMQSKVSVLSDFVRLLDKLGRLWIASKVHLCVTLEEDAKHIYFSLDGVGHIEKKALDTMLKQCEYNHVCEDNILSFAFVKEGEVVEDSVKIAKQQSQRQSSEVVVYNFLEEDDLDDLEDIIYTLYGKIQTMQTQKLQYNDVEIIADSFHQLASILSMHNESFVVSEALQNLADTIKKNREVFLDKADDIAHFSFSFVKDMIVYKDMMFYDGAPSVDFMDQSMMSNSDMLRTLLEPLSMQTADVSQSDIDDIFDF